MSYILEALKRSQQERNLGSVPTLDSTPAPHQPPTGRQGRGRDLLIWLLSLLLLTSVGTLAYLMLGQQAQKTMTQRQPEPAPVPAERVEPPPRKAGPAPVSIVPPANEPVPATAAPTADEPVPVAIAPPADRSVSASATGSSRKVIEPGHSAALVASSARQHTPAHRTTPARPEAPAPDTPAPQAENAPKVQEPDLLQELLEIKQQLEQQAEQVRQPLQNPSPPLMVEPADRPSSPATGQERASPPLPGPAHTLPYGIYQRLPKHRVTVLAYSKDRERRFVILNSNKMLEGERGAEGLQVEKILPNGVVLSFEGHRFFQQM